MALVGAINPGGIADFFRIVGDEGERGLVDLDDIAVYNSECEAVYKRCMYAALLPWFGLQASLIWTCDCNWFELRR